MNAETERLLGWPREELLGEDFHKLCHVADLQRPRDPCPILSAARSGEIIHLDKEVFRTKDGRRFWSSVTVAPLRNHAEEVDGLICVFHDTTREREQRADVERERNLVAAIHKAEDRLGQGTLVVEHDEVVYANDAFLRMSGYTVAELRAMPSYLDLFAASFSRDALRRVLQEGAGRDVRAHDVGTLLGADGRRVPVDVAIVRVDPEEDEFLIDAAVPRLIVVVRDLTRQLEAQEQLRRVVENLPDGVYVTDQRGRITFANAGAERILGLERSRLKGRSYKDLEWRASTPDGAPMEEAELPPARALYNGERVYDHPLSVIHAKTRERVKLRVSASPLTSENGAILGSVVSFNEPRGR